MRSRDPCRVFDVQRLDPLGYLPAKVSRLVHFYRRIDVGSVRAATSAQVLKAVQVAASDRYIMWH